MLGKIIIIVLAIFSGILLSEELLALNPKCDMKEYKAAEKRRLDPASALLPFDPEGLSLELDLAMDPIELLYCFGNLRDLSIVGDGRRLGIRLREFKSLESIYLFRVDLSDKQDLSELKGLPNLRELALDRMFVKYLAGLVSSPGLSVLSLRDISGLENIEVIQDFSSLSELRLEGVEIRSYVEFSKSLLGQSLTDLEIKDSPDFYSSLFKHFSEITRLKNLKRLDITADFEVDISSIEKMNGLESLSITGGGIEEIVLPNQGNLREFSLGLTNLSSGDLASLLEIQSIGLISLDAAYMIRDLSFISKKIEVRELRLIGTCIDSLDRLVDSPIEGLERLEVEGSPIKRIKETREKLKKVYPNTKITIVDPIPKVFEICRTRSR